MHPSKNTFLGFLLGNLLGISQRVFPPKFPPKLLIKTPLMTIPDLSWAFFEIFFSLIASKKITVIYENLYRNSSRKRSRKLFINDRKKNEIIQEIFIKEILERSLKKKSMRIISKYSKEIPEKCRAVYL